MGVELREAGVQGSSNRFQLKRSEDVQVGGWQCPPPSLRKVLYRVGVGGRIGVRAHGEKSGSTWRSHPSTSIGRIRGCGFLTIRCQLQLWRE